jgi:hypothetical protein
MTEADVPMVLLDPDLSGTPDLSKVDLTTLTGDAVYAYSYQARKIESRG